MQGPQDHRQPRDADNKSGDHVARVRARKERRGTENLAHQIRLMGELEGLLLDRLDVEIDNYSPSPELLKANHDEAAVERPDLLAGRSRYCFSPAQWRSGREMF